MHDDAQTSPGVREGDVLAGKYRIEKILGIGGMGVVVAAQHLQLEDRIAIKFLLPQALANREAVTRFLREARAAVKIKSEHVARVIDVGTLESGAPYMVMEYLEGSDLSAWLVRMGVLPVEQAVEFILQAGEAIAEAHALGIVHRDLKPSNLFVVRRADGVLSVKVLDFGISKTAGLQGTGSDLTLTSAVMGSPLYMSPEQMHSSKDADARSDIWALGVILYELLTAALPFSAESMPELVVKIMSSAPEPLRSRRPEAPAGLESVVLKCLEKDRSARFQTVGDLAMALLEFAPKRSKASVERIAGIMKAAGLSASALVIPPSSDQVNGQAAGFGTAASWGRTARGSGGGKRAFFVGGVVASLIAVAIVAVSMRLRHVDEATSPAAASQSTRPPPDLSAATMAIVESPRPVLSVAAEQEPPTTASPSVTPAKPEPGRPSSAPSAQLKPGLPSTARPGRASARPSAGVVDAPPVPKHDCNPNFTLDAQGEKHFKPECFLNR